MKGPIATFIGLGVLLLLLIVGITPNSLITAIAAVVLALVLTALVGVGPEKLGIGFMVLGMLLSPLNALSITGNVTFADLCFVMGFGLLLPRMLNRGRPKLPPLYVIGVVILFVGGVVSSLLVPGVLASLGGFLRVVAAAVVLVFIMNVVHPSRKLVDAFAWAYVTGQIISTGYSVLKGAAGTAQGRAIGLTTQPNFYGLGGQLAYALLIYLFYRVDPKHRWIVVGAMVPVGYSVLNSGSRASLLCCAIVTIAWPIVERSAVTWYVVISGAFMAAIGGEVLLRALGQTTTLDRLTGNLSAQYSDEARQQLLTAGLDLFWKHPIQGNGWATVLLYHNAYLEVAVAGGVLTLVGFVLIIASLIKPLFQQGKPNRLAYAGLSYAAFGMIGPTLYDRIVWAVLCLILVTYDQHPDDDEPEPEPEPAQAAHRGPRPRRGFDLRGHALPTSLDGEPVSRD
ncbi:MAG: O-antigen ligase family protein [Marmoricola sp.]